MTRIILSIGTFIVVSPLMRDVTELLQPASARRSANLCGSPVSRPLS
jgi:hypothetical protein